VFSSSQSVTKFKKKTQKKPHTSKCACLKRQGTNKATYKGDKTSAVQLHTNKIMEYFI